MARRTSFGGSTAGLAAVYAPRVNLDKTGATDVGPGLQALIDAGAQAINLDPAGVYYINSPVFIDATSRYAKTVINANGATLKLGSGLPTSPDAPATTTGIAFFVNTKRTALSGSVVTASAGNRATTSAPGTEPKLMVRDAIVDCQTGTTPNDRALILHNQGSSGVEACTLVGGRWLVAATNGYSDGLIATRCANRNPYIDPGGTAVGSWLVWTLGSGDGIVLDGLIADSTGGIVNMTGNAGCTITGVIGSNMKFTDCHAVHISGMHTEADLSGHTANGYPVIVVTNSSVKIDQSVVYPGVGAVLSVDIQDTANGESASTVILEDVDSHRLLRTGDNDAVTKALVNITSATAGTVVIGRNVWGSIAAAGSSIWSKGTAVYLTSTVTAIQTAITAGQGQLSLGYWELRQRNSLWEVIDPHLRGAVVTRKHYAPTWNQAIPATDLSGTGTLTNGQLYEYAAAMIDSKGNYGPISASRQATATSTGAVRMILNVVSAPGRLVLWRKAGAGVLTTPDAYVVMPWGGYNSRIWDTGANVQGVPWVTSGVPVPSGLSDATGDRVYDPAGVRLATVNDLAGVGGTPTFDPTALILSDEFISGSTTSGQIGSLGWTRTGSSTGTVAPAQTDHPGIHQVTTTTTIAQYVAMHVGPSPSSSPIPNGNAWDCTWWIQMGQVDTDTRIRVGMCQAPQTDPPSNGAYFEKLYADTTWQYVTRQSTGPTQTRTDSGIAVSTSWVKLRVRRINGSSYGFTINAGSEVALTTDTPLTTSQLQPFIAIGNQTAVAKTVNVDLMSLVLSGLSR